MRLKLTAKNTVGGKTSRSSLITNARRRGLGINGFLRVRGRMWKAARSHVPGLSAPELLRLSSERTASS
jgi:hypothetical protein